MHDQVDALLRDLRRADFANVPTANGRDARLKWMKDGWLNRHPDDDGNEVYSLTANALDGLKTVERLTKDRSVSLSSHLIAGLIRHLRDFSASVSPDVAAYIAAQQAEKARIQAEIDRVLDGGELADASDDEIIQGFTELQRFLDELPSDFSRVVESYRDFERRTISDFRAESISSGEAVRRYLAHVQNLSTASAEEDWREPRPVTKLVTKTEPQGRADDERDQLLRLATRCSAQLPVLEWLPGVGSCGVLDGVHLDVAPDIEQADSGSSRG